MMASVVLTAVVVGFGTAMANRLTGWRISRRQPDVNLNADDFESRTSWASDVVSLTGLTLSGVMVAVVDRNRSSRDGVLFGVATCVAVLGGAGLFVLLSRSHRLMNGYPESLFARPAHPLRRVMRRAPLLLPGLTLSVVGGLMLALAAR